VGRKFLVITTILLVGSELVLAQGSHKPRFRRGDRGERRSRELHGVPDRIYQLSPEERQTFRRNAERWLQMDAQQRQILREREKVRREQLKNEADAAFRQSGLRLDPNAREQFESRYLQERRKIERTLRQEVESKRQQELPQLNERLKSEFQPHQGTSPSSTGSNGTGKPKR
jgi:hypothetical protein